MIDEKTEIPEGFKMTELGLFPKGWQVKNLINVATLQRGKDLTKKNQISGLYPVVGSSGTIGYHNEYICKAPGIVTGRSGSIGKLTYVEKDYWPHNTGLYIKDFNGNNPKFIYYLLHTLDFKKYATGVSVPTLNRNFIHFALLPLPPLSEQKKIAAALSAVQEAKEKTESVMSAAKELKKSLMKHLFTYGPVSLQEAQKVKLKDTEIGPIPEEWKVTNVKNMVRENIIEKPMDGNHGGIHPKAADYVEIGIPFLMAADLRNGFVDFSNCKYITKIQADSLQKGFSKIGDVLLTHKGTIGRVATVQENNFPYIMLTPQVTYYRIKNPNVLIDKFLYHYFESENFQNIFKNWASTGSTRAYLGITAQNNLPTAMPDIKIQTNVVSLLSAIDQKIEAEENKKAALEELFKTLLNNLMTAKIRVNHLETTNFSEVAS